MAGAGCDGVGLCSCVGSMHPLDPYRTLRSRGMSIIQYPNSQDGSVRVECVTTVRSDAQLGCPSGYYRVLLDQLSRRTLSIIHWTYANLCSGGREVSCTNESHPDCVWLLLTRPPEAKAIFIVLRAGNMQLKIVAESVTFLHPSSHDPTQRTTSTPISSDTAPPSAWT